MILWLQNNDLSKKKIIINNLQPINPKLYNFLKKKNIYNSLILSSGEEFVPIFTSPIDLLYLNNKNKLKNRGIEIIHIGNIEKGKGVYLKNFNLNKVRKFDHFKNNYSLLQLF